jgi:hypothetical protein
MNNEWPQLLPTLVQLCADADVTHRRTSMRILLSLTTSLPTQLASVFAEFAPLLARGLADSDLKVRFSALLATGEMTIALTTPADGELMRSLIPAMLEVVEACLAAGLEDETCQALEPLAMLVESSLRLLAGDALPHLINFLLRINSSPLPRLIRQTALSVVEFIARCETKRVVKLNLVPAIVQGVFAMSAEPPNEDDEDDDGDSALSSHKMACHLLDQLCQELPVAVMLPLCVEHVQAFASGTTEQRHAMLGAVAVMADGCGEELSQQLNVLLPMVLSHLHYDDLRVRISAFVCVAHFAEHLSPNILDYADQVVPALLLGLSEPTIRVRDACVYALRNFIDTMSDTDAAAYVPPVAEKLIAMLQAAGNDYATMEFLMSALCACANVGKEYFLPYADATLRLTMDALRLDDDSDPAAMGLRSQSTEAISILCIVVGKERMAPHLDEIFEKVFSGIGLDDPELTAASYSFFANMADALKADLAPLLDTIVGCMVSSLVKPTPGYDGHLEHSDSEDDEDDMAGFAELENEDGSLSGGGSVLTEKTAAARSIGPLMIHVGPAFAPHVDVVLRVLCTQLGHRYDELRGESLASLAQLCVYMQRLRPPATHWSKGPGAQSPLAHETMEVVKVVFPFAIGGLLGDPVQRNAARAAIALRELLDELGPAVCEEYLGRIVTAIGGMLKGNGACQVSADAHDDSDDIESGRDIELFDACWDVLIACANCIGSAFEPYMRTSFVAQLLRFMHPKYPPAFGGLALGALHDIILAMGCEMATNADAILDAVIFGLQQEVDILKVNAAVLAGVIVQQGGAPGRARALDVLAGLQPYFAGGAGVSQLAFDNACGAVGRIVGALPTELPLAQLLPVWLASLPVREDEDERNNALLGLLTLAEANGAALLPFAGEVARIASFEVTNEHVRPELRTALQQLVAALAQQEQAAPLVQEALARLEPERRATLQAMLQ